MHAQSQLQQRQDGVDGDLSRQVQPAAAAAVDPTHTPAPRLELLGTELDVSRAALSPNTNKRSVLADDECCRFRILGRLIDQYTLQRQSSLKVHLAKQVGAQQWPGS